MEFEELIHSKYSEPAAILNYSGGTVTISDVNEAFISELWMNVSKEEFIGPNLGRMMQILSSSRQPLRNVLIPVKIRL